MSAQPIQAGLVAIKTANSALAALIGDRFYVDALPPGYKLPAVAFQVISFVPKAYVFARVGSQIKAARVQFDGYVTSVRSGGNVTRETLASAIRGAFERYNGTIGGVTVQDSFIEGERAGIEQLDTEGEADHVSIDIVFYIGGLS